MVVILDNVQPSCLTKCIVTLCHVKHGGHASGFFFSISICTVFGYYRCVCVVCGGQVWFVFLDPAWENRPYGGGNGSRRPLGTWELVRFRVPDDHMMPLTVTHMAVFYNVHVLCRLCSPRAQVPTLTNPSTTI